jgi:lipopolysaccharide/colanic/teichoic acid biosynthesis glycosyltransferase
MKNRIIGKVGLKAYELLRSRYDLNDPKTLVLATTSVFNIANHKGEVNTIINLSKANNIRYINKFFKQVNSKLVKGNEFVCCLETISARKKRSQFGKIPVLGSLFFTIEFIFLRAVPKIWGLKKIYFGITKGRNRLVSKAEILGRLVSCGFEIVEYGSYDGTLFVVSRKSKEPEFNPNVSYGPLFKTKRLGKNGKLIEVYKLRTMHPYAEYLQDYVLKLSGYADTGKPANDFRLTPWGGFFRRYWLDELPQLINVFKGEMKLVGVRPVTPRYFEDIPKDLQELRLKQKPGCIPPYVFLDRKSTVESVLEAEREYLIKKTAHPYFTDTGYFFKAIFNIVFKGKRSA